MSQKLDLNLEDAKYILHSVNKSYKRLLFIQSKINIGEGIYKEKKSFKTDKLKETMSCSSMIYNEIINFILEGCPQLGEKFILSTEEEFDTSPCYISLQKSNREEIKYILCNAYVSFSELVSLPPQFLPEDVLKKIMKIQNSKSFKLNLMQNIIYNCLDINEKIIEPILAEYPDFQDELRTWKNRV